MKYTRKDIVRMFKNAFVFLSVLFLSVIVTSAYKIIKANGNFWPEFTHQVFVDPALAIPFVATFLVAVFLIWRHRKIKTT
jgi:hypothetical protein